MRRNTTTPQKQSITANLTKTPTNQPKQTSQQAKQTTKNKQHHKHGTLLSSQKTDTPPAAHPIGCPGQKACTRSESARSRTKSQDSCGSQPGDVAPVRGGPLRQQMINLRGPAATVKPGSGALDHRTREPQDPAVLGTAAAACEGPHAANGQSIVRAASTSGASRPAPSLSGPPHRRRGCGVPCGRGRSRRPARPRCAAAGPRPRSWRC